MTTPHWLSQAGNDTLQYRSWKNVVVISCGAAVACNLRDFAQPVDPPQS
jgi:hypothetical protein